MSAPLKLGRLSVSSVAETALGKSVSFYLTIDPGRVTVWGSAF